MSSLSDAELLALLTDLESDAAKRKSSFSRDVARLLKPRNPRNLTWIR